MPDNRIDEAYRLYQSGMSLKDIAEQFGISPATVRSWKSRNKWGGPDPLKKEAATGKKTQRNTKKNATQRNSTKEQVANMLQPLFENTDLTESQKMFCIYFVKSFNATQSYLKAYGCQYSTALTSGPALLGNPRIKLEIARLKQEKAIRAFLEPGDIIEEYLKIAFGDLGDYAEWAREWQPYMDKGEPVLIPGMDGKPILSGREVNVVKLKGSSEVDTSIVSEIKQGKDGTSIKLHDKMRALDWLADHMELATAEQRKRMELMTVQTKKLKSDIERAEGDETELSKLDRLLEGLNDQSDC